MMYGTKINSTVKSLNNFVKAFFMQLIHKENVRVWSYNKSEVTIITTIQSSNKIVYLDLRNKMEYETKTNIINW